MYVLKTLIETRFLHSSHHILPRLGQPREHGLNIHKSGDLVHQPEDRNLFKLGELGGIIYLGRGMGSESVPAARLEVGKVVKLDIKRRNNEENCEIKSHQRMELFLVSSP
jgi:hypothetical protein